MVCGRRRREARPSWLYFFARKPGGAERDFLAAADGRHADKRGAGDGRREELRTRTGHLEVEAGEVHGEPSTADRPEAVARSRGFEGGGGWGGGGARLRLVGSEEWADH